MIEINGVDLSTCPSFEEYKEAYKVYEEALKAFKSAKEKVFGIVRNQLVPEATECFPLKRGDVFTSVRHTYEKGELGIFKQVPHVDYKGVFDHIVIKEGVGEGSLAPEDLRMLFTYRELTKSGSPSKKVGRSRILNWGKHNFDVIDHVDESQIPQIN